MPDAEEAKGGGLNLFPDDGSDGGAVVPGGDAAPGMVDADEARQMEEFCLFLKEMEREEEMEKSNKRGAATASGGDEPDRKRSRPGSTAATADPPAPSPPPELVWNLMSVHPSHQVPNIDTVSLLDLFSSKPAEILFADYMIDPIWLVSAYPYLRKNDVKVTLWLSDTGGTLQVPAHWNIAIKKGYSAYGSHHSKFIMAFYPAGSSRRKLRLAIHTANLIYCDVNNKAQGVWTRDFFEKPTSSAGGTPGHPSAVPNGTPSTFEADLLEYLSASGWDREGPASRLPSTARQNRVSDFDFSSVDPRHLRLVGSVPGRHTGAALSRWGHMKVRRCLSEAGASQPPPALAPGEVSELLLQFSSVGSLNQKWVSEFVSGSLGCGAPAVAKAVWPTIGDVRSCVEGYNGGRSIPGSTKNVQKLHSFLGPLHRWSGNPLREATPPHIKTYTKVRMAEGSVCTGVDWSILTSANLSMAAWGKLEVRESQLYIMNYELGVLCMPGTPSSMLPVMANVRNPAPLAVPLPFAIPPAPYGDGDEPWVCDRTSAYGEPDCFGVRGPVPSPMFGITQD